MLDVLLFGALPYVAMVLFLVVSVRRYRYEPFSFSSLSSQFLESRRLFWGSVPFHVGILVVFFGHLTGVLFPRELVLWNRVPVRLLVFEVTGLAFALLALVGLCGLLWRRLTTARLRVNTSPADLLVHAMLFFQVLTGLDIALRLRWGSTWFAEALAPYLRSIFLFQPDVARMAEMPLSVKLHVVGAFFFFAAFSYTRLVHILVAPVPYLWRPLQVAIWNRARPQGPAA